MSGSNPSLPRVDAAPALIFSQTVEGLLRALGPLAPDAAARFQAVGLHVDRPLEPAYPVQQWLDFMRVAAALHAPGVPFEEAVRSLGHRFVDSYGETFVGRAMLVGLRLLGPARALERLSRTLASGSNFFETATSTIAPRVVELSINRVTWPEWYFGLIERGLEHAGAKKVEVSLKSHLGLGKPAVLLVRWAT